MTTLSEIWMNRTLPEAFYTPKLVDTRPMGGGSFENVVQFAAIPDGHGTYSVKRYEKSLSTHESGGKPVVSIIDIGLNQLDAQQVAMANLRTEKDAAILRHADYADHKRFTVSFRHSPPRNEGFRWLTIRKDDHAMANPPYPVPPAPAYDKAAYV